MEKYDLPLGQPSVSCAHRYLICISAVLQAILMERLTGIRPVANYRSKNIISLLTPHTFFFNGGSLQHAMLTLEDDQIRLEPRVSFLSPLDLGLEPFTDALSNGGAINLGGHGGGAAEPAMRNGGRRG